METPLSHWVIFNLIILLLLLLDLFYFHRKATHISITNAIITSIVWILLALTFNIWIAHVYGKEAGIDFLTGYLLEKALSVDNLFIFLLVFAHFRVPDEAKHHVLFYGILGAIVMRAGLIVGGIALVRTLDWIFYIFGAFLIYSGIKLAIKKEDEIEHEKMLAYRLLSKCMKMTPRYYGIAFWVKENQHWVGTPLFVVLILIETTDLVFALDSIPAILGITTNAFIVYTSNIFAILGLRSLFFALEGVMRRFYLLHYALSLILIFIGVKMILADVIHIPTVVALIVLVCLLILAFIGSILFPLPESEKPHS